MDRRDAQRARALRARGPYVVLPERLDHRGSLLLHHHGDGDGGGDDDGACGRKDVADVSATIGGAIEIRHLTGVSAIQPLAKERELGMRRGRRNPARVKTEPRRLLFDLGGSQG